MTEQLLWQAFGDQVKHFDARIEPRHHRDAVGHWIVEEMGEITPSIIRLSTSLERAQSLTRKAALEGRIKAIQEFGEAVEEVLKAAASLCSTIETLCRQAADAGHAIESWHDFEKAAVEIRAMPDEWRRIWPFIDPEMLERTAIDYAEGRYQSARDAFYELRSHRAREDQA